MTVTVVTAGDSITEGWYIDLSGRYPVLLQERLGPGFDVINTGYRGRTTTTVLARWVPDVIDYAPMYAILNIGTNDIRTYDNPLYPQDQEPWATCLTTMQANVTTMCNASEAAGIKMILCKINGEGEYITEITIWNEWITTYAAAQGYDLIDFYTPLDDPLNPGAMEEQYGWGNVHPNALGFRRVVDAIDYSIFHISGMGTESVSTAFASDTASAFQIGWDITS